MGSNSPAGPSNEPRIPPGINHLGICWGYPYINDPEYILGLLYVSFGRSVDNAAAVLPGSAQTFRFADSRLSSFDRITDLAIGSDGIDGPTAVSATNLRENDGNLAALTEDGIQALLHAGNNTNVAANGAATFVLIDGSQTRTFLALNDATAGYQASLDGLIEITGYTGSLANLAVI